MAIAGDPLRWTHGQDISSRRAKADACYATSLAASRALRGVTKPGNRGVKKMPILDS